MNTKCSTLVSSSEVIMEKNVKASELVNTLKQVRIYVSINEKDPVRQRDRILKIDGMMAELQRYGDEIVNIDDWMLDWMKEDK